MKPDQGASQLREGNSQIREGIWSIPEGKRRLKNKSPAFSHGVTPSAPHHSVMNDPGKDSKNSSSM